MRFVITGGLGFIGSNFIRMLFDKDQNAQIMCIDKVTYAANKKSHEEFLKYPQYSFVNGDICDYDSMLTCIEKDDYVINFAAESHVDRSITDPNIFVTTNIMGVNNLLNVCRKKEVAIFLQISTDEVYGSLRFDERPSVETDALRPSSPYSASKAAAEMLCFAAVRTYGQNVVITRSSNNYGPYQFPEKLIPLFISKLIRGEKLPLYGNGKNIRDWIHVRDNCEAIYCVCKNGEKGEVYNIGGANQLSNLDITSFLLKYFNKDKSHIEYVQDRLGHDLRYDCNSTKINKLGWSPKYDFVQGLTETIEWYKKERII